jgi:transposase-like protein
MNTAYDWRQLADLHRPTDEAAIGAEIRRLYQTGLKPRDISSALRLDISTVIQALARSGPLRGASSELSR